jgi:DNA-binding LacI/PurR family transcriptional regulator
MRPLYQTIFQELHEEIARRGNGDGDRLASENDLCARFQTSRQTVRNAIDLLVARGLVERRAGKGAFITWRDTESKATEAVNILVVDGWYDHLTGHVRGYRQILRGISSVFPAGSRVSLQSPPAEARDGAFWKGFDLRATSGMIVVSPRRSIWKHLSKAPVPIVVTGNLAAGPAGSLPAACVNTFKMGFDVARILAQQDHRLFGFCSYELDNEGVTRFIEGAESALVEFGLKWNPALRAAVRDDWTECRMAVDRFLDAGVTCIVMFDSDDPSAVYHYLTSKGLCVPEDVSLLVLELDVDSARRPPFFSGFLFSAFDLGARLGRLMQRVLAGDCGSQPAPREVIDLEFAPGRTLRRRALLERPRSTRHKRGER